MAAPPPRDRATSYAESVVRGKVPSGELVRLSCERHLTDLKAGPTRGLQWDAGASEKAVEFFWYLRHSKGEWAGTRFELQPWQAFIVGSLFGWKREDGFRRFRTAYNEVARKNGKSTMAAGIGLLCFVADGEPGAEVYTAATKRDQARIVHSEAVRMVKRSPALRQRIGIHKDSLFIESLASFYRPLGADADTMDGLNPHAVLIDELHAHKTRAVWDVLDTATGSRRQPLLFTITTAGTDRLSVCYEQHGYAEQVLKRVVEDDTFFAFVASIDDGDDWTSEAAWKKANPNYGVSVKPDDMRRLCEQAQRMPSKQNAFKRLRLTVWTQQVDRWISLELWDAQAGIVDEARLRGRTCYGGLDLASVSDLVAWVMVFPDPDDPDLIEVVPRFWCPEARLYADDNRYKDQYQAWHRAGLLKTTPGTAIDYDYVKKQILEDASTFRMVDLNIDRLFQAHQLSMQLIGEGMQVAPMGMGFLSMAAPMKELERSLLSLKIRHGGHPVLRWMADNMAVSQDPAGNFKPDKKSSQGKIDGIVALVMAIDRWMRHRTGSVYDRHGIRTA